MTERIERMLKGVLEKTIYPEPKAIEYDRADLFMPDVLLQTKRLCKYMLGQDVVISADAKFIGQIRFDACPYPSNFMAQTGAKRFREIWDSFYNKPFEEMCTFEWQHATPNFADVIENGIEGIKERINDSLIKHKDDEKKIEFLNACQMMCDGIIAWENKCVEACMDLAQTTEDEDRKSELLLMAENLKRVPRYPARNFYEAVQSLYFCFDFLTDSIGTPDRYLYKFYVNDIKNGTLTNEEAKELIQELFIRIQSFTPITSDRFTRGGESHFSVGGYTLEKEDGYNELSELILCALMELPLFIPQASLRWTPKTPFETLLHVMDLARKDPHKRIAFVIDEPRIKAFMENCGTSWEDAVNYTMVGCNEPALQGGMWGGSCSSNPVKGIEDTLYNRQEDIINANTFDEFYAIFEEQLQKRMKRGQEIDDGFNYARSKDVNVLGSLFLKGCIESGTPLTSGGSIGFAGMGGGPGIVCTIDSLAIIKQFVYDEKIVSMKELLTALENNWEGYEELRNLILKKGKFFGNDYETSNEVARRYTTSIREYAKDKTNIFGRKYLAGNLCGYNPHNVFFGKLTKATPDGRFAGDPFSVIGICQNDGKDREGLSALLNSIAQYDPTHHFCGASVTNVNLEETLIYDDENFEKTVKMIETYFRQGGLHIQINTVKREELIAAKENPQKHKTLRVRVSGFSDYFVNLPDGLQDNIIARTKIEG